MDFFGLAGKRVEITKGPHKGKKGTVLKETGYTEGYGVVCKIRLDSGFVGEWTIDFFKPVQDRKG